MHPCLSDTVPVFREVGIASETAVFLENIEYNNSYRKGETVFGALEKGRFIFRPVHSADVAIGICALRRFGDERFLSRAIPLLRVRLFMPNWSFALGEIDAQDCHGLPDLLYRRERRYDPGTEEGAQFRIQTARTAIDLWVHWDSLNSPLHRERFIAGLNSRFAAGPVGFPLLATAVHSGGERYDTGLPVENRFGGGGGMTVDRSVPGFFSRFSFSLMALGSARQVRDTAFRSMSGFGLLARIGITPGDFDCSATCFKGRNIDMPVGNPVYRSNRPLYVLEVSRKYRQGETFSAEGGVRLEIVESSMRSFCSNPQHRWWVALQGNFSHFFGRRVD